jgi:MoxR-like ATPase
MEQSINYQSRIAIDELNHSVFRLRESLSRVIVGQEEVTTLLITALLANGHVLLEGVPGVAKTLIAKLLARSVDTGFSRIQFTPDLMPSDVLGTTIFNNHTSGFEFNKGPIFSNIVLIDEINRAPAKTQSALFEVMEERQVTTDGVTRAMESPFMVVATQNPVEHEGTYRLPEAQLDRFLFKIDVGYPDADQEFEIIKNASKRAGVREADSVTPVMTASDVINYQKIIGNVVIDDNLMRYIAAIVTKTRSHHALYLGASPRASLALLSSSRAYAAINGRDFVTPDDIKKVVFPVLSHRIVLTPEKEMEGIKPGFVVRQIIDSVEVPR